jgi:hypothetical protein
VDDCSVHIFILLLRQKHSMIRRMGGDKESSLALEFYSSELDFGTYFVIPFVFSCPAAGG